MNGDDQRAAEANARLARDDVEWAASPSGGIYLRYKDSAMARNTVEMGRRRESERQTWLRNYNTRQTRLDKAA